MQTIIFKTVIYKDTTDTVGLDITQNNIDKTDFETNYKSQATTVNEISSAEALSIATISFADFKIKVGSWVDVVYSETPKRYDIFLFDQKADRVALTQKATEQLLAILNDTSGEKILKVFDVGGGAGVPPEDEGDGQGKGFKKPSFASETISLAKGQLNKLTIKPRVLSENMILDQNVIATLNSGGITDVGQVFRMTAGLMDIDRVHLTLEAIAGGALSLVDDFEGYADTTALRAIWAANDTTNTPNTLETTIFQEGAKAMKVQANSSNGSKNDTITKTYGVAQDWSAWQGLQFQYRRAGTIGIDIIISDGTNSSKKSLTTNQLNQWEFLQLNFADFLPVSTVGADLTQIRSIQFKIVTVALTSAYIDRIELFSAAAFGNATLEVYSFGATSNPTSLGAILATTTFALSSGKKIYEIPITVAGLTPNNYIGVVITNLSVGGATLKVYGKNGQNKYTSGFAFKSIDNGTNITSTGSGDDVFFNIFCVDKAIFHGLRLTTNADTGQSKFDVFVANNSSGKNKDHLFIGENMMTRKEAEFATTLLTRNAIRMDKDDAVFLNYNDDSTSAATKFQATIFYNFIDRPLNG